MALEELLFLGWVWYPIAHPITPGTSQYMLCPPSWGSYLEQGTDISVITLQGPQFLSGCFLELGVEAPGGAALNREEERNLLKRKCAELSGRRSSMPHRPVSVALASLQPGPPAPPALAWLRCSNTTNPARHPPSAAKMRNSRDDRGSVDSSDRPCYIQPREIWVMPKAASYLVESPP